MSGPPPPPRSSSAAKVFGALVVLSLVAVLGVVGGVLVTQKGIVATATGASPPPATVDVPATATAAAADAGAAPVISAPPVVLEPSSYPTVLGASDAGTPSPVASSAAAPTSKPTPKTKKTEPKSNSRAGGQKPEGDEYGF